MAGGVAEVAVAAESAPAAADDASPSSAPPSSVPPSAAAPIPPTSGASGDAAGVLPAEGSAPALGEAEVRPSGADGTRGGDSATELELEPLSPGNVDAVARRSLAQ
ncbi:hypothetical protein TorRG33x02_048360, partial [Trema orientale]